MKIDLSQAYFHVPIKPHLRRFLSVAHAERMFQMTSLPFASAPLTFARLSNWIASCLRKEGLRIIVYLDDFLLAHQDKNILEQHTNLALKFLKTLGWIVNWEKSMIIPERKIEYLGLVWDTKKDAISLPKKKIWSLEKDLCLITQTPSWNWTMAKRLLGKLNFTSLAIPLDRLHSREMQKAAKLLPELAPEKCFRILAKALENIRWWIKNLQESSPPRCPDTFLTTDAADQGWGAQIGEVLVSQKWDPQQQTWHINMKELFAVLAAIQKCASQLKGKTVLVQSDNKTVVSYIRNQGGTRSAALLRLTTQLLRFAHQWNISLVAHYIPGICNNIADGLSRNKASQEWHLTSTLTQKIFRKWGIPQIDLFASNLSKVVPTYVTRNVRDPQASFTDAFSKIWRYQLAWIFSPPSLIPRVLRRLNSAEGVYILIVPKWQKVFWRADLKSRVITPPFQLRNL